MGFNMKTNEKPTGLDLLRLSCGKVIQNLAAEKGDLDLHNKTDKLYLLTQHLMRERCLFLPKYGIFANLEERLEPVKDITGKSLKTVDIKHWKKKVRHNSEKLKHLKRRSSNLSLPEYQDNGNVDVFMHPTARMTSVKARATSIVHAALWANRRTSISTIVSTASSQFKRKESVLPASMNTIDKIAFLRRNVHRIEGRFKSMLLNKTKTANKIIVDNDDTVMPDIIEYAPSRFENPGEAKSLFRKYARIIIIVHKWLQLLLNNEKCNWERELRTFVDLAVGVEESNTPELMKKSGLSFDKSYFKINKEISLSIEVRKILCIRPEARTPEMLKQVLLGLQSLQSLGEYPLLTQEKICKVAWYQKVPSKKVIVRQGHHSESFYFVLGGTAFVKKVVEEPKTLEAVSTTVAKLTRGQSFGEVGLIFNGKRTGTVESASEMELLVIEKSDFFHIFMNADDPDAEANHIIFLRHHPLLKNWPVDVLKEEPNSCFLHYFKRGTLVVEDCKKSEWIYFIKSGTCEVIKSLKPVKPRKQKMIKPAFSFPDFGTGSSTPRIDSGIIRRKERRPTLDSEILESMESYYTDVKLQSLTPSAVAPSTTKSFQLPNINIKKSVQITITSPRDEEDEVFPVKTIRPSGSAGLSRSTPSRFSNTSPSLSNSSPSLCLQRNASTSKRTIRPKSTPGALKTDTKGEEGKLFIKVELLQANDVFGLNTLKFVEPDDSNIPSVSLVSKGSEIVMLSKRLFVKHADEIVRGNVLDSMRYYPRDITLQDNLQIKVDWEQYRHTVIKDTLCKFDKLRSVSGLV